MRSHFVLLKPLLNIAQQKKPNLCRAARRPPLHYLGFNSYITHHGIFS
jgi:hypothetical protein